MVGPGAVPGGAGVPRPSGSHDTMQLEPPRTPSLPAVMAPVNQWLRERSSWPGRTWSRRVASWVPSPNRSIVMCSSSTVSKRPAKGRVATPVKASSVIRISKRPGWSRRSQRCGPA